MSKKIRTIFIGTPDFGCPALTALAKSTEFEVVAVITQPDKKVGRKQILTAPAIKTEAEKLGIPVFQPVKINNYVTEIKMQRLKSSESKTIIDVVHKLINRVKIPG